MNKNVNKLPGSVPQFKCYRFNLKNIALDSFSAKDIYWKNMV